MKYYLLTFLLFRVAEVTAAISGITVDRDTEEPLPFTSIAVSGKSFGTVSNAEGYFVLNQKSLTAEDTLLFSHVGYETLRISVSELAGNKKIYLVPAAISLSEVAIYSKDLTPEEILEKVRDNYADNHPVTNSGRKLFLHRFEKARFPKENKLVLNESDFVGLDEATFNQLFRQLPDEFVEYQDVVLDWFQYDAEDKLVPEQAISLEEGSTKALQREFEKELSDFFEDIETTNRDEETYYKFRTGILSMKADDTLDSTGLTQDDSTLYKVPANQVSGTIRFLLNDYGRLGKNWEFITDPSKYRFRREELTVVNDELAYCLSFSPKKRGLFQGKLYVSMSTYGVLRLDFKYASGKSSENIQLFGVGHSMKYKEGHILFERGERGYHLKYIFARQQERAHIARDFSVMKKEKRFLWDKTLNEMEFTVDMRFDMDNSWELLVLETTPLSQSVFSKIDPPRLIPFKKEYVYSPEMWENRTVIAPTAELLKFSRKSIE